MTEEYLPREEKANVIVRLWRGDVPLWKTYWIYGALVGAILNILLTIWLYQRSYYAEAFSKFDQYFISYFFLAVIIVYSILISVGIWRSANKYRNLYPTKRVNAALAKFAVFFGALAAVGQFAKSFDNTSNSIDEIRKSGSPDQRLQLEATIAGLNKDLPKMIDTITRLNKIDINDRENIYFETVTVQLDNLDVLQTRVKPSIAKGLCAQAGTLSALKDGRSYHYVYADSDGKPLGDIVITKADCPT